jgi:hypothetical protein
MRIQGFIYQWYDPLANGMVRNRSSPSPNTSQDNDETSFAVPDFENSLPDIGTSFDMNSNSLGVSSLDKTGHEQFGDGTRFDPFGHNFDNP